MSCESHRLMESEEIDLKCFLLRLMRYISLHNTILIIASVLSDAQEEKKTEVKQFVNVL